MHAHPILAHPQSTLSGYDDIDNVIKHYESIFCGENDVNGKCDIRPIEIETEGPPIGQSPYRLAPHKATNC